MDAASLCAGLSASLASGARYTICGLRHAASIECGSTTEHQTPIVSDCEKISGCRR
jgi:hypothetical protein